MALNDLDTTLHKETNVSSHQVICKLCDFKVKYIDVIYIKNSEKMCKRE